MFRLPLYFLAFSKYQGILALGIGGVTIASFLPFGEI